MNKMIRTVLLTGVLVFNISFSNAQTCNLALTKDKEYSEIQVTTNPVKNKATVLEFFWYGCVHCAKLDESFSLISEKYKNNKDVSVIYVPAIPSKAWEYEARLFYAVANSKRLDLHSKIFEAIHHDKVDFKNKIQFVNFFNKNNANGEEIYKEMSSFGVEQKINQAIELTKTFKIMSTPTVIVNNRYLMSTQITDVRDLTKNTSNLVDFLVCKK